MTTSSRKWMWLSLASTLVLGVSLGVLLDRLVLDGRDGPTQVVHNQRERGEGLMTRLTRELGLTAEQQEDLEQILAANREKARAFNKQTRDSYARLREEFRSEIRTLLSSEQQERFEEMLARQDTERSMRKP